MTFQRIDIFGIASFVGMANKSLYFGSLFRFLPISLIKQENCNILLLVLNQHIAMKFCSAFATTAIFTSWYILISTVVDVDGHGYLKTPRSRNFVASQDGKSFGGTSTTPLTEYCPHCLNRGGPLAACGLVDNRNYDTPPNAIGGTMPTNIQGTYPMGGTMEVDVVLTAHHMGHFEFHACPLSTAGAIPTQACFKSNPVKVVRDVLYGAPVDVNYPNRAYIPPLTFPGIINESGGTVPGTLYRYILQLPENLRGNLVLLQWYYLTGNSCQHPGYDTYPFPAAWGGNLPGNTGPCNVDDNDGGSGTPERFWNCAEISIVSSGPVAPIASIPLPAPSPPVTNPPYPIASPVKVPTPVIVVPVKSPVTVTSPSLTTNVGTCGGGTIGNGSCANTVYCCSKWGYCGTTSDYCGINAAPIASPVNISPITATTPTSVNAPVKAPSVPVAAPIQSPVKVPITAPAPAPVSTSPTAWVLSTSSRCGMTELDARGNCGRTCTSDSECTSASGTERQWCFNVHSNYCGSKPIQAQYCNTTALQPPSSTAQARCGINELEARERCGDSCSSSTDCAVGENCWSVHANTCSC